MHRIILLGQSISLFLLSIVIFTTSKHGLQCVAKEPGNFISNFNKGLRIAGDLFGVSTAADVANLVTEAFSTNSFTHNSKQQNPINGFQSDTKQNVQNTPFENDIEENATSKRKHLPHIQQFQQQGDVYEEASSWNNNNLFQHLNPKLITNILRLVGFDVKKLGNLAIHIFIIITQAISKGILSIDKTNRQDFANARVLESDKTFSWLFRHPSINTHGLLDQAMDRTLADKIIAMIADYEKHTGQAACLQLLICKCAPFIRGMQQSLSKWLVIKDEDDHNATHTSSHAFHNFNFPTLNVYQQYEKQCESNYTQYCNMSLSHTHI